MSLPLEAYRTKSGVLFDSIAEAATVVENWGTWDEHKKLSDEMSGWPKVALVEAIAGALLVTRGYDLDELEVMIAAVPAGTWAMDAVAEWERRGPTLPAEERKVFVPEREPVAGGVNCCPHGGEECAREECQPF